MEEYFRYLSEKRDSLLSEAKKLALSDRNDEANLTKVRANIYDICQTVCKVHMNRPSGGAEACRSQFEHFRTQWGSERDKALSHGDTQKAIIEEIKLNALADAAQKFEEACR